jgi:hypothetical protein
MAVVTPLELDDHVPAGGGTRHPQRRHGRLGARADEANPFQRRHRLDQQPCDLDLAGGRRAEARPGARALANRRSPPPDAHDREISGPHEPSRSMYACPSRVDHLGTAAALDEHGMPADRAATIAPGCSRRRNHRADACWNNFSEVSAKAA